MENPTEEFKAQVWDEHLHGMNYESCFILPIVVLLETKVRGEKPVSDSQCIRFHSQSESFGYVFWSVDHLSTTWSNRHKKL